MSSSTPTLNDLRRQIDEIDTALHDLLMRRVEIVGAISAVKKGGRQPAFQPSREATILRRLVLRHAGNLPPAILVRVWREIMSGTAALQSHLAVAVYAPDDAPQFWDLARDHFGSHTPMMPYRSAGQVLRALSEGPATVGVLPMPEEGEADPWWPHLLSPDDTAPHVIARLPFGPRGNARGKTADALVVGPGKPEATGADCCLLAIETRAETSRARLLSGLTDVGFQVNSFISHEPAPGVSVILLELDGIVAADDPSLADALRKLGGEVDRIASLGGYARPLSGDVIR